MLDLHPMSFKRTVLIVAFVWLGVITMTHGIVNLQWLAPRAAADTTDRFRVGFLPVTCHLTCPVTDFINRQMAGDGIFEPLRFSGWPELKEAFLAKHTSASFILAPMAMALREEGVPIKIVYLGHRDGTAMMVHKDSLIYNIKDLKGKRVAVPNRFSNQRLLVYKALRDNGMTINDIEMVELPPPDMPAALFTRAVDAVTSGEPFMGQTELDGYGRVLYLTKDVWPNFISCVLAIHEDVIRDQPEKVQQLVDGIARSGKWIEGSMDHRMQAADFVARNYYNQNPRLLRFVLSKPPDRVRYTQLTPLRPDFEEIMELGIESGILKGKVTFEDYVDTRFAEKAQQLKAYEFESR
jgi:NitT/TauT family transport system substrate-binding protein